MAGLKVSTWAVTTNSPLLPGGSADAKPSVPRRMPPDTRARRPVTAEARATLTKCVAVRVPCACVDIFLTTPAAGGRRVHPLTYNV